MGDDLTVELTENLHPAEWGVILISLVIFLFNMFILGYIIKHRNYPPIRAKQVGLVVVSTLAGWCWVGGHFVSFFLLRGEFFKDTCVVWLFFFQLIIGGYLWIVTLIGRLLKLYIILVKPTMRVQAQSPYFMYMRMFVLYLPGFILTIIAWAVGGGGIRHYHDTLGNPIIECDMDPLWTRIMVGFAVFYFFIYMHFAIKLRNIRLSFNEFQGTKRATLIMLGLIGIGGLIMLLNWDIYLWARCVGGLSVVIAINLFFTITTVNPVWGCYWNRTGYAERFRQEMSMEAPSSRSSISSNLKAKSKESQGHSTEDDEKRGGRTSTNHSVVATTEVYNTQTEKEAEYGLDDIEITK